MDHELFEIQKTNAQTKSSWIVGDEIISDGSLFVVTPYDVTFVILSSLEDVRKASPDNEFGFFCNLNEIYAKIPHLRNLTSEHQRPEYVLRLLCDSQGKYNCRQIN